MDDPSRDEGSSRQLTLNELIPGQDVTHLLSQINHNFKQSKADQILRLLHDQDKISDDTDDSGLIKEYNQIREENVVCDSDTLSDSSSDTGTIPALKDEPNRVEKEINERKRSSRTSIGVYNGLGREHSDFNALENKKVDRPADTRERSARPKSSYVRRPFRRRDEQADESEKTIVDYNVEANITRPISARPRARYGSAAARKVDRKIEMFISGEIDTLSGEHLDIRVDNTESSAFRNRFSMTRTPKRESQKAKKFCEDNNSAKLINTDTSGLTPSMHIVEVREEVQYVQSNTNTKNSASHLSSFNGNVTRTYNRVPNTRNVNYKHDTSSHSQDKQAKSEQPPVRSDYNVQHRHDLHVSNKQTESSDYPPPRQEVLQNDYANMDTDIPTNISDIQSHNSTQICANELVINSHVGVRRNDSASGHYRCQNPQPVQSRPLEARPSTRRRLPRRYIQPKTTQKPTSIRPTSESVLLARQKTEKNLIKRQMENRPQSEKIVINGTNKFLSITENPAQGPQTSFLTSKGGIPQPLHVQNSGFRGYDPSHHMNSSARSGDMPGDVTLPRKDKSNVMLGGRKPLALMKLPPLEALAAKKKERGLQIAARETCV